jgi:hypothetical protein
MNIDHAAGDGREIAARSPQGFAGDLRRRVRARDTDGQPAR